MLATRQQPTLRLFLFLVTTNVAIVWVRSMSIIQPSRRASDMIPFLYRTKAKIQLPVATAQWSNFMMQFPFSAKGVTRDVRTGTAARQQLTRTMVHQMNSADLKDELEKRGLLDSGIRKFKRPNLVTMLLAEVPRIKSITKGDATSSTKGDLSSTKRKRSVKEYPMENIQIDPNATYCMDAVGVVRTGKMGSGIGIVMRERDSNAVVWQAQIYYPGFRSPFECNFCAVILALRFALDSFKLSSLQLHPPNIVLTNQITGNLPVTKPSLLLLLGQVNQLVRANDTNGRPIVFQLGDKESRVIAAALAAKALKSKKSLNLGGKVDNHLTVDPMIELQRPPTKRKTLSEEYDDPNIKLQHLGFVEPDNVVINPSLTYKMRFDGGSRGNPGIAGAGIVLYDDQDREIWQGAKFLGHAMSNNLAEYSAINLGLAAALSMGIERIYCEGDSELVVKQLNGVFQVKSDNLRGVFDETQHLMREFQSCEVRHIRREYNRRADELANQAMTTKTDSGFDQKLAA